MNKQKNLDRLGGNFVKAAVFAVLLATSYAHGQETLEGGLEKPATSKIEAVTEKVRLELRATLSPEVGRIAEQIDEKGLPKEKLKWVEKLRLEERVELHPEFDDLESSGSAQSLREVISDMMGLERTEARVKKAEKILLTHLEKREWGEAFNFSLHSFSTLSLAAKRKLVKVAVKEVLKSSESIAEEWDVLGLINDTTEGISQSGAKIELKSGEILGREVSVHAHSRHGVLAAVDLGEADLLITPERVGLQRTVAGGGAEGWEIVAGASSDKKGDYNFGLTIKTSSPAGFASLVRDVLQNRSSKGVAPRSSRNVAVGNMEFDDMPWVMEEDPVEESVEMQTTASEKIENRKSGETVGWWGKLWGKGKKDSEEKMQVTSSSKTVVHQKTSRDMRWDRLAPRSFPVTKPPLSEEAVAEDMPAVEEKPVAVPEEIPLETQPTS